VGNCDNKKIPVLAAFKDDDGGEGVQTKQIRIWNLEELVNDKNQEIF
jgi:hypothetical protein